MTIYIDKETRKRVNIHYAYKGFSRLETPEEFEAAGVIEIAEPMPPEDYIADNYFVTESDDAPYVIYTKKSDEMIARQDSQKAADEAQRYLASTDYLFYADRHAELLADEPEREAELKTKREAARTSIREHKAKYPEIGA